MSKAIAREYEKAKAYGREYAKKLCAERFQFLSQGLRLSDAEAGELFEIVSKAMEEEMTPRKDKPND